MRKALFHGLAVAVSALSFTAAEVWAQGASDADRFGCGPNMVWSGGGWYGMMFGPLLMILVLAGVVAVVMLLVRWLGTPSHRASWHQGPPSRTALDILKERFARGEINKDEFEERRRVLDN